MDPTASPALTETLPPADGEAAAVVVAPRAAKQQSFVDPQLEVMPQQEVFAARGAQVVATGTPKLRGVQVGCGGPPLPLRRGMHARTAACPPLPLAASARMHVSAACRAHPQTAGAAPRPPQFLNGSADPAAAIPLNAEAISFETNLFGGRLIISAHGAPGDVAAARPGGPLAPPSMGAPRRLFHVAVQGSFKRPVLAADMVSGQEFPKPPRLPVGCVCAPRLPRGSPCVACGQGRSGPAAPRRAGARTPEGSSTYGARASLRRPLPQRHVVCAGHCGQGVCFHHGRQVHG